MAELDDAVVEAGGGLFMGGSRGAGYPWAAGASDGAYYGAALGEVSLRRGFLRRTGIILFIKIKVQMGLRRNAGETTGQAIVGFRAGTVVRVTLGALALLAEPAMKRL